MDAFTEVATRAHVAVSGDVVLGIMIEWAAVSF
jgi:hypothetical protein